MVSEISDPFKVRNTHKNKQLKPYGKISLQSVTIGQKVMFWWSQNYGTSDIVFNSLPASVVC